MGSRKRNKGRFDRMSKVRKKTCPIVAAGIAEIDYKDVEFLKQFVTEKGKIIPRRISGINARNQKLLTRAIKRARNVALLSFSAGYVEQEEA